MGLNNLYEVGLLLMISAFSLSFNPSLSEAQMVPAMFVFGDSLVDVGNNNHLAASVAKADFPHNGIDFPTKKATGRFSNGKNAADFLAEKVGLPSSPPYLSLISKKNDASFLTGVSFASGGAGIFDSTDQIFGQSIPLTKQVDLYTTVHEDLVKQLGSSAAQNLSSKSLFLIVIGSNDLFDYSGSSDLQKSSTPQQLIDSMISKLKEQLKRIYDNGARKFVFAGIGPMGCCPTQRKDNKGECNEKLNSLAVKYNEELKSMLQGLKSELNDIKYSIFSTYTALQNILQKPAAYGFTEIKSACCGLGNLNADLPCVPISKYCSNRREHVFWDIVHPTEAVASIFVDAIFDGPSQYTFPVNARKLVTL